MTSDPKADLVSLCKARNLRLTGPRRIILNVLSKSTDHPDAAELHRRITQIDSGIAIATVYRTLNLLEEKGLLEKHVFSDGRARFESADQEHHDHLIDIETGDVVEFRSDEIEQLQEEIARKHGFEIVSHKLEIYVRKPKRDAKRKKPTVEG